MAERRKIVLIGAGSAMFTQGLIADFMMAEDLGKWEIALCDIDSAALESIAMLAKRMIDHKRSDIVITSSTDRRQLLPGTDFVVATVAVGGRRAWESDVFIPRKYGVFQPVGDTTMPGGISRALRMIPAMLDIARDIQELCPKAQFFNYSNPMTAICQAMYREGIPVTGLCHGVIHVEQYLARAVGADPAQAKSIGAGLNHLTFLYDIRVDGEDIKPALRDKLAEQKRSAAKGSALYEGDPFSWDFFEKYDAFPAVLDRHVTEFFPERFPEGRYYGKVLGIDTFSFEGTIANGDKAYAQMGEQAQGIRPLNEWLFERASGEHEQLIDIIRSIDRDERKMFSVNVPNRGAVPQLPYDSVLELPAVAAKNGFYPIMLTDFPDLLASFLRKRITVVDLTVEAALTGSKSLFVESLLADGAVMNEETATKLADELLEVHRPYLPQFFH